MMETALTPVFRAFRGEDGKARTRHTLNLRHVTAVNLRGARCRERIGSRAGRGRGQVGDVGPGPERPGKVDPTRLADGAKLDRVKDGLRMCGLHK